MNRNSGYEELFPENEWTLTSTCGSTEVLSYRVIGFLARKDASSRVIGWRSTPSWSKFQHVEANAGGGDGRASQPFPWEEAESLSSAFCSRSSLLLFHYSNSVSPVYCAERLLPPCSFRALNSIAVSTACILNLIPVLPLKSGLRWHVDSLATALLLGLQFIAFQSSKAQSPWQPHVWANAPLEIYPIWRKRISRKGSVCTSASWL